MEGTVANGAKVIGMQLFALAIFLLVVWLIVYVGAKAWKMGYSSASIPAKSPSQTPESGYNVANSADAYSF